MNQALNAAGTSGDESSYSSFYSSFLKTDEGQSSSNEGRNENENNLMNWDKEAKFPLKRPIPQWLENVDLTNDLVYRYQVDTKTLPDVLSSDLYALKNINQVGEITLMTFFFDFVKLKNQILTYSKFYPQPECVNDQLQQLYLDLELEGFSARLSLESTSGSSGEDDNDLKKKRNKKIKYSKFVLIFEENCPLPTD